jgi:hypothetical protein
MSTTFEIGKGLTQPAKFEDIIEGLFQNEKIKFDDNTKQIFVFSEAKLTPFQKNSLDYLTEVNPLDAYIIYVINNYDEEDVLIDSTAQLVSFVHKCDKFIYGYYFDVDEAFFDAKFLEYSKCPIDIPLPAVITFADYFELYTDVKKTTVGFGYSTESCESNLQYSEGSKYFYTNLGIDGITDLTIPKTELEGLSNNLKKMKDKHFH